MARREEIIKLMFSRATEQIPAGEPIFPDGRPATSQEVKEFVRLCKDHRYEVLFSRDKGMTRTPENLIKSDGGEVERWGEIHLTARPTIGLLTDEFLHAWNNRKGNRGKFLEDPDQGRDHKYLATRRPGSGSKDDRRLHQLELKNFLSHVQASGGHIPSFIWRTFTEIERAAQK